MAVMTRWIMGAGLFLGLAAGLSGCGEQVEGSWVQQREGWRLEFFDTGDVSLSQGPLKFAGTWQVIDNGKMKIELTGLASLAGAQICLYAFEKGNLLLAECGLKGRYDRAED